MKRTIILASLAWGIVGQACRADGPMADVASLAWAATDAVLARQLDPPTRQQMIMDGVRTMARSAKVQVPPGLARRVSNLPGPEPLAALLVEVLAGPKAEPAAAKPGQGNPGLMTPEDAFIAGLLSGVPGGAMLMPEKERVVQESFEANLYVGVQVQLGMDEKTKRPTFVKVLEGGPADLSGARDGDLLEEVAGESTAGMSLRRVVDLLRGAEGTDVVIRLLHPSTGELTTRTMTRGRLARATIQGFKSRPGKRWEVRVDDPAPIGYLKVNEIAGSTPQELRAFAAQLEAAGAKGLVLDLRDVNPAQFHATVLLADALLDGGVIGRVKSLDGEKAYRAEPDALLRGWPMVVLAPHQPLEPEVAWLCAALGDNHRATILGDPVPSRDPTLSETIPLPGGEWSIRMATGRLIRGDGRPLANTPDRLTPEQLSSLLNGQNATPASSSPYDATSFDARKPPKPIPADQLPRAVEILTRALEAAR